MFKVGQKVWAFTYGWGEVENISPENCPDYPICVKFNDETYCFTTDGRYTTDENRTVFFKEIPIPDDALIPPVEELVLRRGDVILFNTGEFGYVSHYSGPDDSCFTFHGSVPQGLDDAYSQSVAYKAAIKKVVGRIDD